MRLKWIVLAAFAACAGCLEAVESEAFRIENRTGRDGAVVTGVELVGEADGSDVWYWDTAQEEDGWITLESRDDAGDPVTADVLALNGTAVVIGGLLEGDFVCSGDKPVVVRNETHVRASHRARFAHGTRVAFTAGASLVIDDGATFVSEGIVLTDFSPEANEVSPDAHVQGASLVSIDFVNGGSRVGPTHHYTAGERLAVLPESPRQDCATFLGWASGETFVTAETRVTAGMREITARWKYHELTLAPASHAASALGGALTLSVAANISWKVDPVACDWITVRGEGEGTDDGEIVFDVAENASTDARACAITVRGGGLTRTIVVNQEGMEQLDAPSIRPNDGYELTGPYVRVVITAPPTMPDAEIRFTTDGSEPTASSPLFSVFNARETTTIKARAFTRGYLPSPSAVCHIIRHETLADAMDVPLWKVTTDEAAPWSVVDERESWDGKSAVRSAPLEDSDDWDVPVTSTLRTAISGAGTLSFRWRVDCEESGLAGEPYDYLALVVDGERVDYLEGDSGWRLCEYEIDEPGLHEIEWVYTKDAYGSEGEDAGWIDAVSWTPRSVTAGSAAAQLEKFGIKVPVGASAESVLNSDADGDGLTLAEELVAGTDPNDADSNLRARIEVDGEGTPVISPEPDLSPERDYVTKGKLHLDDVRWSEVKPGQEVRYNFFKIEVREK